MVDLKKMLLSVEAEHLKTVDSKVENIEQIIKSMKDYLSNDFDPLDDEKERSEFNKNADDLMHAVVIMMVRGGWKNHEITDALKYNLGRTDKELALIKEALSNAWEEDQKKWEEDRKNMSHYTVTFWITYFDREPEEHYTVTEGIDAKNLDSLFDILEVGIQNEEITPEQNIPDDHKLGNLNVEFVIIHDADGKEVYRDKDFKEELVPVENRIV